MVRSSSLFFLIVILQTVLYFTFKNKEMLTFKVKMMLEIPLFTVS